jgi:hypothetical protein
MEIGDIRRTILVSTVPFFCFWTLMIFYHKPFHGVYLVLQIATDCNS